MKMKPHLRRDSGMTLTELVVSIGIMTFIFGAMAYLVFMTGRNSFLVREQALSQSQASAASQRITNTLRGASELRAHPDDDKSTTLTRIMYDIPVAGGVQTGIVAYVPASTLNESDGVIKIFENAAAYDEANLDTTKADYEFEGIQDFNIMYHTPSWVTLRTAYSYRGFILSATDADNDGVQDKRLAGEFLTDVIAKNHHPGESAHYAETTSTLFQL